MRHFFLAATISAFCVAAATANTYTVTSTADAGAGTLRQAILVRQRQPGARHNRVRHLRLRRPHDHRRRAALSSQSRSHGHDRRLHAAGLEPEHATGPGLPDNSVHRIEIDGTNTPAPAAIFVLSRCGVRPGSDGSSPLRGLVINRAKSTATLRRYRL